MRMGRTLKSQQRWTDKKLYPWVLISLVLTVLQYWFELKLIGVGLRYQLWITWIPLVTGITVLGALRWDYLKLRAAEMEGFGWKMLLWIFMLVQGALFSYTSFGLVARTTADIFNRMEVRYGAVLVERYAIDEALMGRTKRLSFTRDGRLEMIHTTYVKELADQRWDPPFDILLETTPGILGTTIVLDYSWVRTSAGGPSDQSSAEQDCPPSAPSSANTAAMEAPRSVVRRRPDGTLARDVDAADPS